MDANLTRLYYALETNFGEVPDPAPKLKELRFLSSSLQHDKLTEMSEEIRSDRSRSELIQVGKSASGAIEAELLVGPYDDFILCALMASGWIEGSAELTVTAAAAGNTLTITGGTFPSAGQQAKYLRVEGLAASADNGVKRVVSASGSAITLDDVTADQTGATVTVSWRYARNGTTKRSMLVEQNYVGISSYAALLGLSLNQWSLTMEARSRILQTLEFMGAESLPASASSVGDGSPAAPSSRFICETTNNIPSLQWNGAALTANVMGFSMQLGNNLRDRPALSRATTLQHGSGRSEPDGTINTYFESRDLLNSFIEHEDASLLVPVTDPEGNLISLWFPRLQFPTGFPTIEGVNTDVMLELAFNAVIHRELGYVLQVDRLDLVGGSS